MSTGPFGAHTKVNRTRSEGNQLLYRGMSRDDFGVSLSLKESFHKSLRHGHKRSNETEKPTSESTEAIRRYRALVAPGRPAMVPPKSLTGTKGIAKRAAAGMLGFRCADEAGRGLAFGTGNSLSAHRLSW